MGIHLRQLLTVSLFVCLVSVNAKAQTGTAEIAELMPRSQDRTSMWWRDGFAGIIDGASWRRVVQTGYYWFLFDADSVKIPRLGPVTKPLGEIDGIDLNLQVEANGKIYFRKKGKKWTHFEGPRLIESGNVLQRTDVRGIEFVSVDGETLNAEARFETSAWADQLGMSLAVRPGVIPFKEAEATGGRVKGGFGLSGRNRFDIPPADCTARGPFTLSFWAFVPSDYKAGLHNPWLVCQNGNETVDGNFGIMLGRNAVPSVRINLGGGKANMHRFQAPRHGSLKINQWNHLALSYDNSSFKLMVNGRPVIEEKIGKPRKAVAGGLAFGARQDGLPGFNFRGLIDEIHLFDRALKPVEAKQFFWAPEKEHQWLKHVKKWCFRDDLSAVTGPLRETWNRARLSISLYEDGNNFASSEWTSPREQIWSNDKWEKVALRIDPVQLTQKPDKSSISVKAVDKETKQPAPVTFEPAIGWHRVNLDKVKPATPKDSPYPPNDLLERIQLNLENPSDQEQVVRLMFEKTVVGLRQSPGQSITGITAMIRDSQGNPTGIPVQLSKNWHTDPEGGKYSGVWFHGISQLRLPPKKKTELELTIAYGHWGGVAAASHAQLSLIGYGGNHLWEQSALGAWGESICYNPEQVFGDCVVTDIRPLMVKPNGEGKKWNWTENVGGADFFRAFDLANKRIVLSSVRSTFNRTGPCLTDVLHEGVVGRTGIPYQVHSSLSRTDDLIRATYRLRMDVKTVVDFSRFVFFQCGSDGYAYVSDEKMAAGNAKGPFREWLTERGGETYRGNAVECTGNDPWASLHKTLGDTQKPDKGAWATRGIIIRKWNARLGGKPANPWIAERGNDFGPRKVSLIDVVPPPEVKQFQPGDFVDATIEFVVIPQYASEYYGPNEQLRNALEVNQDTWKMVHRESVLGHLDVKVNKGQLENVYPGVTIAAVNEAADFEVEGGVGYVPITVTNLKSHKGYSLNVNDRQLNQAVHGNDYWQTDYDAASKTWSLTYNVPVKSEAPLKISFGREN